MTVKGLIARLEDFSPTTMNVLIECGQPDHGRHEIKEGNIMAKQSAGGGIIVVITVPDCDGW